MRWHVEAADSRTGRETQLTIEALTEAEAERLARYNGLLVSKVRKVGVGDTPVQVVAYARPREEEEGETTAEVAALRRRGRATNRIGVVVSVVGWLMLVAGVGVFAYVALRSGWGDWKNWRAWALPAAWRASGWVLGGAVGVVVGSVMRLLAAMAVAMGASGVRREAAGVVEVAGGGVEVR